MKLTGKALEAFWQWYFRQQFLADSLSEGYSLEEIKKHFLALDNSFKWGIYVDFFDSVGIVMNIDFKDNTDIDFDPEFEVDVYIIENDEWIWDEQDYKTRAEARKAAIEKANEIYNERGI